MSRGNRTLTQDLALRAAGLMLLLIGAFALHRLFAMAPERHVASLARLGLAAIGFVGLSTGATLAALGAHIRDEIPVSERWERLAQRPPGVQGHRRSANGISREDPL